MSSPHSLRRSSNCDTATSSATTQLECRGSKKSTSQSGDNLGKSKEIFLTAREAAAILGVAVRSIQRSVNSGRFVTKVSRGQGGQRVLIALASLPQEAQVRYWREQLSEGEEVAPADAAEVAEHEMRVFNDAPAYNQAKALKYKALLQRTEGMKCRELQQFVEIWNSENPEQTTSIRSLYRMRVEYEKQGISALLGGYGKTKNRALAFETRGKDKLDAATLAKQNAILEKAYEVFKSIYLTESAPSVHECWRAALGVWIREGGGCADLFDGSPFLTDDTFANRVKREMSEDAIFRARYGYEAWNRKHARFLDRDLSAVAPGECWVVDHHQLDVAVHAPLLNILGYFEGVRKQASLKTDKIAFPWLTAILDFRTGRMVGWHLHVEAPNSDHLFQAFQHAASRYGLPRVLYLDNGKDMRSKDFAGGRVKNIRFEVDEKTALSLVAMLDIRVVWAIPYGAQSKLIERSFRALKDGFAKFCIGYRGGDVTERPERLDREIAAGLIMTWDMLAPALDTYIEDVQNTRPQEGKHLRGHSPAQAWTAFRTAGAYVPRRISDESLMLFCCRIGESKRIGRNGYYDAQVDGWYYSEWMGGMRGVAVYVRRDPRRWQIAWCFDAETHQYIGQAALQKPVAALAESDVDRAHLREALRVKNADRRISQEAGRVKYRPDTMELVGLMSAANLALAPVDETEQAENVLHLTPMDSVMAQDAEMRRTGTSDISAVIPVDAEPKKKIIAFESDYLDDDE